jgi:hypothetical protein
LPVGISTCPATEMHSNKSAARKRKKEEEKVRTGAQ